MQACDRCHARKTRCDRRLPQCSACEKAGTACLHVDKLRQRNVPRGYVENMEIQVQKLLEENSKLQNKVATLRRKLEGHSDSGDLRHEMQRSNQMDRREQYGESTRAVPICQTGERNVIIEINESSGINSSVAPNSEQDNLSPQENVNSPAFGPSARTVTSTVITEVEYLSLKATGETRYVGSSSGVGLASIIESIVDSDKRVPLVPAESGAPDMQNTHVIPSSPSDPAFPTLSVAMPFIEAYFQHTHVTFPLLHRPSFLQVVNLIYNQADYYESNPYDSYVFNMVLAIGSSNFNRFEEATARPATHYARAQAGLNAVLGMQGTLPLKAIVLLSQHGIFSNLRDTSASIYHLVGIAARMCFEQGLHSDSKFVHDQDKAGLDSGKRISFVEEMRRRCFWCLYNLDRVVSFTLGRPVALRDDDINISLPSHLDDDNFSPDIPIVEDPITESNPGPRISPFLHLIHQSSNPQKSH